MITLILCAIGLTSITVVIHGAGAATYWRRIAHLWATRAHRARWLAPELLLARLVSVLLLLHLAEAMVWAFFFVLVGALPHLEAAAYYSLTSYTTVGYGDVVLPEHWRLLGPIESAVGVLMLGWSTGILVAVIGASYREHLPTLKPGEPQQ